MPRSNEDTTLAESRKEEPPCCLVMAAVCNTDNESESPHQPAAHHDEAHDVPTKASTFLLPFLFGQLIALVSATMSVTSFTLIQDYGVETQFFQLFFVYVLLSTHLFVGCKSADTELLPTTGSDDDENQETTTHHRLPFSNRRLVSPWWVYFFISILDVNPNYLSLASFRYTSLTSTTLLGSLTVPSTMLFTRVLLSKTFGRHQYCGVVLCVMGGALTMYQDTTTNTTSNTTATSFQDDTAAATPYIGDLFAVAAAMLYGLGDAVAEYSVKKMDRFEYLGMLGLFGMILTIVTIPFAERQAVMDLLFVHHQNTRMLVGLFVLYIASVALYYMAAARFLVSSDATLLNLSLQSVNLWAIGFTWMTKRNQPTSLPSSLFFVALILVLVGVCLYETGGHCGRRCRIRTRTRSESQTEMVVNHHQTRDYNALAIHSTTLE